MAGSKMLDSELFWNSLDHLLRLENEVPVDELCRSLDISPFFLVSMVNFLNSVDCDFSLAEDGEGRKFLSPTHKKLHVNLKFSLLEWLKFQAHFPKLSELENKPYHQAIKEKLLALENKYPQHDLFKSLGNLGGLREVDQNHHQQFEQGFKEAVLMGQGIRAELRDGRNLLLYPHRVVNLDGELSVIGEDINDKCFLYFLLSEVTQVEAVQVDHRPLFTKLEVEDFISSLRGISETEIRLILKILTPQELNLNPEDEFLGRPCVVMNGEGQRIWAASIEPSESIFSWLFELGQNIEILDPISFKKQFLEYCQDRLSDEEKEVA